MFINLTNHPSEKWSEEQLNAARRYGEITDIPFPLIDENATEAEINRLADDYFSTILSKGDVEDLTIHIMGEQTFCYALISKLQKEGVHCIASCTKRDVSVNEEGQTVSTFHFTNFREYVPPRTLRWWIKTKKKIKAFWCEPFKRKSFYSWNILLLVLLCEVFCVISRQTECLLAILLAGVFAGLVFILYFISIAAGLRFSIRSAIVSKLLANAIAPTTLGTLYLLAFVIHVGWLTNVILGLYTENGTDFLHVAFAALICVWGLIALIIFFPVGKESKNNPKTVYISGISEIKKPYDGNYSKLNLRPLVRILQNEKSFDNCELLILRSDYNKISDEKLSENIRNVLSFVINTENSSQDIIDDKVNKLLVGKDIKKQLETLVKEVARREFPERTDIDNLIVEWTNVACDYNDFKSCYNALDEKVKVKDDIQHRLICCVSPGTAMVAAVLTLISIDGDRELYYYSQDDTLPDSNRMKYINKNDIPLQNLLSQALESLEYNK